MFYFVFSFAIITDSEISFLSVSVEKTIRKVFRARSVFVKIVFTRFFVVVVSFVVTSDEITMSIRNTEEKIQSEQNSFLKKNSNDVESSHFDVFSSSLSFDHSRSNDQKSLNFFDDFSIVDIDIKTMPIRIWCEFCARCAKTTTSCVFFFENINCQRCERNKEECVSINFYIFKNFQRLFFLINEKMSWNHRKTIAIFIREKMQLCNFEMLCFNNDVSFSFVICIRV